MINPGSVILSGVMLLEFIGWKEAAKMIESAMEKTIQQKSVTYDFERQLPGATKVGTSGSPRASLETCKKHERQTLRTIRGGVELPFCIYGETLQPDDINRDLWLKGH